jgi:hypothetical protein
VLLFMTMPLIVGLNIVLWIRHANTLVPTMSSTSCFASSPTILLDTNALRQRAWSTVGDVWHGCTGPVCPMYLVIGHVSIQGLTS